MANPVARKRTVCPKGSSLREPERQEKPQQETYPEALLRARWQPIRYR